MITNPEDLAINIKPYASSHCLGPIYFPSAQNNLSNLSLP